MQVTSEVNLPQEILNAQADKRLVLFVGAGASVDSPSDLPLFSGLARQLADMARVTYDEKAPIDFFLGGMPDDFDVHRHARDLIACPSSQPNPTHMALMRLAAATGAPRIVTTNYDDYLRSAAEAEGLVDLDNWIGPALPLGDDFTGIVHLHGSITRDPHELVLTDQDFGRAYVTQAWATRFLVPLFQRYVVVFIGYSHDDPIMRYLARGLPPGTSRYAFTKTSRDDPNNTPRDDPKWAQLGIGVIEYPVSGRDHNALVRALDAWSQRAQMGRLDHEARMKEIVDAGTILTPVDRDYLVARLQTEDGAQQFTSSTTYLDAHRQAQWLRWIESLPEFEGLFTGRPGTASASVLMHWFCWSFVAVPELHGAALQTVQRLGQAFSPDFYAMAKMAAEELTKKNAEAGRRWKTFLATSIRGFSAPPDIDWLLPYEPGDQPEPLAVLQSALRPFLVLGPSWRLAGSDELSVPWARVVWSSDRGARTNSLSSPSSLSKHIEQAVRLATPGDARIGAVLEESLNAAYDLLGAYYGGSSADAFRPHRLAIEPHEQDRFPESSDAIINGLRDYGVKALPIRPDLPERWWAYSRTLFQRLALHLITESESRTPDDKVIWLLDRQLLYESRLKHEVYRVLQSAVADTSDELRATLLQLALAGPELDEDYPHREWHIVDRTLNLLVWLQRCAPSWHEAVDALAALQSANPDLIIDKHPDADGWVTSGMIGGVLPMEQDDFIEAFDRDADTALENLLNRDYSDHNFGRPIWQDALTLISQVAESRPDIGDSLWALADRRLGEDRRTADIHNAVIKGWGHAEPCLVVAMLPRVAGQTANADSAMTISSFLLSQVGKQANICDPSMATTMRQIARDLWHKQNPTYTHPNRVDLFSGVALWLNSWPGELAQYWLGEIDRRWTEDRDGWTGLDDKERDALTAILAGPAPTLDATLPFLTSNLWYLYVADTDFTAEYILPLFNNQDTMTIAWGGYLQEPRYDDRLLALGLLDGMVAAWDGLATLESEQFRFYDFAVAVISFSDISPENRQTLLDRSILASDGAFAIGFAQAVVHVLQRDPSIGPNLWERWLRDHLAARLDGRPRTATSEELACWADVVPFLGTKTPEAIQLIDGHGIGLEGNQVPFDSIPEKTVASYGVALVEHYCQRVRNTTAISFTMSYKVNRLIETLRAGIGEDSVQPLLVAARESGLLGTSNT